MADNSRSPDVCPWDPGEVCKAANGACLPPRKRLLAGLRQNGWLSSAPPYFQGASQELKLEVDLTETKHECTTDAHLSESPTCKQGECNAVEERVSVSVKSKRAIKKRKSLSILADCRTSVKNLEPELLKSCSGSEIQEKARRSNVSNPKREQAVVYGYDEMVDAARAAAAKAAKAAVKAKSIALEKAAAAAKAAAIARAALEAVALAAENELLECQPDMNGWASCEQNRIGKELAGECGSGPKFLPLPHLPFSKSVHGPAGKKFGKRRTWSNGSTTSLIESKDAEKTHADQSPTVTFHAVDTDTVLDRIQEDKHIQSGQNSLVAASVDDNPVDKYDNTQQTYKICTFACPMPPPSDDEKLARQLHRAMNSSPRISRSQACLEYCRKSETSPFSMDGYTQIKYPQTRGCSSSREKRQRHKGKLRVSRSSTGKADIKIKSMTVINETLNKHQNASIAQCRLLGSTGSCFAASAEYRDAFSHKNDDLMPDVSNCAFISLSNCNEDLSTLKANCNAVGSLNLCSKPKGVRSHCQILGSNDHITASQRLSRKSKSRRRKQVTGKFVASAESGGASRDNELLSICTDSQSETPAKVASEQTGFYDDTSYSDDYEGSDENQDGIMVSGPGSIAGVNAYDSPAIKSIQENSFWSKSGRAAHRFSDLSVSGERQKRDQKILGVLANRLTKGNRIFGKSLTSYLPSQAAL